MIPDEILFVLAICGVIYVWEAHRTRRQKLWRRFQIGSLRIEPIDTSGWHLIPSAAEEGGAFKVLDYDGRVTDVQFACRRSASTRRSFYGFDEVVHAGWELEVGSAATGRRIMLGATAFRDDLLPLLDLHDAAAVAICNSWKVSDSLLGRAYQQWSVWKERRKRERDRGYDEFYRSQLFDAAMTQFRRGELANNIGNNPDTAGLYFNDAAIRRALLAAGFDPNTPVGKDRRSLLTVVSTPDAVEQLIGYGADVNMLDTFGRTPLDYILSTDEANWITELLLEKGAIRRKANPREPGNI